jgi:WD40 repeat protein
MNGPDDENPTRSDSFLDWLAACDEAIAQGRPLESGPAQQDHELIGLLQRLDGLRVRDASLPDRPSDDPAAEESTEAAPAWGDESPAPPPGDPEFPDELDARSLGTIDLPSSFGDYELLELIAAGGMGIVCKARQKSLDREVAVKLIRLGPWVSRSDLRRFQREAEAAAQLDHPSIVPVHEVGRVGDQPFFSMRLMEGGSLEGLIGQLVGDPRAAGRLVLPIAQAVHHAHQHGILHRDLKPANVLLDAEGRPCVADFGLARSLEGESTLTQHGSIVGTPSYMAPEQAAGSAGNATIASDVYGLGAILYALITGQPPFRAKTPIETLRQVIDQEPVSPRAINFRVDRDLEAICLKALDKQPKRRYTAASALAEDLEGWLAGKPIRARRIGQPERVWKWAKRHPGVAALGGLLALVIAVSLISVLVLYGQAVVARTTALEALDSSQASLYANRIALANQYRQVHDSDRADALLEECPAPLRDWEWRYLKRRSFEDVRVYGDHDGQVFGAVLSPDGRYLVSRDRAENIHVRDRATNRVLKLPGMASGKAAIAISPDGEWLAVGGSLGDIKTGAIQLWSTKTWSEVRPLSGVGEQTLALTFSPDSRRLVSGHRDDKVRVWDLATGAVRTLSGHESMIEDVAVSPDGRLIASASRDTTVRIWDAMTGDLLATLRHERQVFSVAFHPRGRLLASSTGDVLDSSRGDLVLWDLDLARSAVKVSSLAGMLFEVQFSPDGGRLATAGFDGVVRIWDSTTLNELLPLTGHAGCVRWVEFSSDGNELISCGDDGAIRSWNAAPLPERPRRQPMRTFSGHEQAINSFALTSDGRRLVSASEDGMVFVWDVESGRRVLSYRKHKQPPYALAVRPDGEAVATSGNDLIIRIWDSRTGADLIQLEGHTQPVMALAFHPDGVQLASASQDGTVRLWDTRTGKQLHQFLKPCWLFAVAFTPDGGRLAAAGNNNTVHVWDVASRQLLHVLSGHTQRIVALAFHPDSEHMLSASLDGTVRFWSGLSGQEFHVYDGVRGRGLAWSPDGRHFAVSGAGGSLKVWEAHSGRRILTLKGHADDITGVLFSPNGGPIITSSWDHNIKLWEMAPDSPDLWAGESHRLVGGRTRLRLVAALPDGKRAISGGEEPTIHVWDIASGRELRRWNGSDFKIYSLAVTPDGKRVVVAGEHTDIRVFEIETGRELRRFHHHAGAIFALAVTPDGRHALAGGPIPMTPNGWKAGSDRDLHLWDLDTGEEVRHFSGHRDGIWSVAISPDGHQAVSGAMDGTVLVWDMKTGAQVRCLDGHPGFWVTAVGYLPDGRRVLSGATDYHLRLWDVDAGRQIRSFYGARGPIDGLAIAPDGRHALSSGILDHHLRLWDVDTGRELYHYEVPHVQLSRGTYTRDGRQAIWAASDGALRVWDIPDRFTGGPPDRESPRR